MRVPKLSEVKPGLPVRVYGASFQYEALMFDGERGHIVGPSNFGGRVAVRLFKVWISPGDTERIFHYRQLRIEKIVCVSRADLEKAFDKIGLSIDLDGAKIRSDLAEALGLPKEGA